jgi:hypothetical protein
MGRRENEIRDAFSSASCPTVPQPGQGNVVNQLRNTYNRLDQLTSEYQGARWFGEHLGM